MAVGHMMDHLAQGSSLPLSIFGIELGLRQAMHGRAQIRRSASDLAKKHVFLFFIRRSIIMKLSYRKTRVAHL